MHSKPVSERPRKRCLVAADAPQGPWLCPVVLPVEATIAAALEQARRQTAPNDRPQLDWEGAAVGLWGVRRDRGAVPGDGDRIEVYRPLAADPRQRRRQQLRTARLKRP